MRHHAATVLLVGLTWTVMHRVSAVYVVWVAMLRVEARAVRSVWLGLRGGDVERWAYDGTQLSSVKGHTVTPFQGEGRAGEG